MIYSMTAFARLEVKKRLGRCGMGNSFRQSTLFRKLFPFTRAISRIRKHVA